MESLHPYSVWKLLRRKQCRCVGRCGKAVRADGVGNDEMGCCGFGRERKAGLGARRQENVFMFGGRWSCKYLIICRIGIMVSVFAFVSLFETASARGIWGGA